MLAPSIALVSTIIGLSDALFANPPIQQVIANLKGSEITRYNSDLTRDTFVKQIHSHNDYWRDVPLFTALSYGVQSVEADVWYFEGDDELYVGHHESCLNSNRTLSSLYVEPLVDLLDQNNPESYPHGDSDDAKLNGVFDTDTGATLYLFIDVKTDGELTWPLVEAALEPFREAGYLTYFNGTDVVFGPITIVGTGNTPYDYVSSQETRDYFFDGPLANLTDDYPYTLNPIASTSLQKIVGQSPDDIPPSGLNQTQIKSLTSYIEKAHSKKIKSRIWGVPWWPVAKRDNLNKQILAAGSDFLNADDLDWAIALQ